MDEGGEGKDRIEGEVQVSGLSDGVNVPLPKMGRTGLEEGVGEVVWGIKSE